MVRSVGTGAKYYYDKGFVRIGVNIAKDDLMALKILAVDKSSNGSVISVVEEATSWLLNNYESIPSGFPAPQGEKTWYTYINKEAHRNMKRLGIVMDRNMCDIMGFILTVWARGNGEVA